MPSGPDVSSRNVKRGGRVPFKSTGSLGSAVGQQLVGAPLPSLRALARGEATSPRPSQPDAEPALRLVPAASVLGLPRPEAGGLHPPAALGNGRAGTEVRRVCDDARGCVWQPGAQPSARSQERQ